MTSSDVKKILLVSGRGRYEDVWHDMAATSHRVATVLSEAGHEVVVRGRFVTPSTTCRPQASTCSS